MSAIFYGPPAQGIAALWTGKRTFGPFGPVKRTKHGRDTYEVIKKFWNDTEVVPYKGPDGKRQSDDGSLPQSPPGDSPLIRGGLCKTFFYNQLKESPHPALTGHLPLKGKAYAKLKDFGVPSHHTGEGFWEPSIHKQ